MIPTRWFDAPAYIDPSRTSRCGRRARRPAWCCTPTPAPARPTTRSGRGFVSIYAAEAWWWAARPFWVLLLSGVFERHPGLKYSIAENGAWWVPDLVARMDEKWEGAHNTRKFGDVFKLDLSR